MTSSWRDRPLSQTLPFALGIVIGWFAVVMVLVSACSVDATTQPAPTGPIVATPPPPGGNRQFQAFEVRAGERTITCIYGGAGSSSVLSCDWGSK